MAEGDVVELRVHGVSGTPPEELLDCPLVQQLAGDARAGFYKPRLYEEERDPRRIGGKPAHTGPRLEGYAWGGLTSGAPSRAFWLLLLPFTMTNVAPRLRPRCASRRSIWVLWFVGRLTALSMTVLLVTALCGVGDDLFGWQCRAGTSQPSCDKASPGAVMQPLLSMSVPHRLAVGALLPLLALVLFWLLSGRTINNYEGVPIALWDDAAAGDSVNATEPELGSRWMWRNEFMVRRMRHLHLQAGFVTVLWIVSYPFSGSWDAARIIVTCVLAAYLVAMLCVPAYMGRAEIHSFYAVSIAVWTGLAVYAALIARALLWGKPFDAPDSRQGLPGFAGTALAIFVAQLALFVLFAAVIVVMAIMSRRERTPPSALGNCASIIVAVISVFLGAVFSSGFYIYASAWLRTGSLKPGFAEVSNAAVAFHMPSVVRDACRAYAVSVFAFVATVVVIVFAFLVNRLLRIAHLRPQWPTPAYRKLLVETYGDQVVGADDPDTKARAKKVAKVFWWGRQVDFADRFLAVITAIGLVITGFFMYALIASSGNKDCTNALVRWHQFGTIDPAAACPHADHSGLVWTGWLSARSLQGTGAYLVIMSLVLLVALGAAAFRVQSTRRSVGILWDLASFWPRGAHPFAAPCYAERTVPDLITRVYWYARTEQTRVVLAGHSQGTVISAATLFQLAAIEKQAPEDSFLGEIRYFSFGCVLRRLYARYFPAYFSSVALDELRDEVLTAEGSGQARWRNMWRFSDYLGGQVMSGPPPLVPVTSPVETMSVDPVWARPPGDTIWPQANRHSYYWGDPLFAPTVAELAAMPATPADRASTESTTPTPRKPAPAKPTLDPRT